MDFDYFNQVVDLRPFITKMKNNQLTLENILEEDDIINDIKTNTRSEFIDFITNDKIKKLIDYSTKMPISDNLNIGYKYPFNATEILCSDNTSFQNKLMLETPLYSKETKIKDIKEKLEERKNIRKGGFISELFKIMNKVENNDINDNYDLDAEQEEINEEDLSNEEFIDDLIAINDKIYKNKNKNSGIIYENVDYLLNFLKESEDVKENYVLVGYFFKILNNLINLHSMKIVQYLYDYPKKDEFDILDIFVKHMNRKSMCDIIRKLITFEDDLMTKFEDKRINLFEKVLDELNITQEKDKYECICDCLYLIMNNNKFFEIFLTKNHLMQKIYNILINSYKNNNLKKTVAILQLIIKIHENILLRFEVRITENPINLTDANEFLYGSSIPQDKSISSQHDNSEILKKFLLLMFEILEKNEFSFLSDFGIYTLGENGEFISTDMKKQKKIGIKKIKQTEYISTLLDIFVNAYNAKYHEKEIEKLIEILNKKGIFWNLHDIFFLFPNSNLYQILYKRIIEIVINENSPKSLIDAFFYEKENQKRNLIELYINKTLTDNKPNSILNPCFSFVITLMNNIYISQNPELRKIIEENKDIHIFIEVMVEDFNNFYNQKLLYNDVFDTFNMNNTEQKNNSFGKKNILEIFEENKTIYKKYKSGEDYKILLNEKKKRIEEEKEKEKNNKDNNNFNSEEKLGVQYIDDLDDDL